MFLSKSAYPTLILLLVVHLPSLLEGTTLRYRSGVLYGEDVLSKRDSITVAEARQHCMHTTTCVAFTYQSTTRFPADPVSVFFFPFADWHVDPSSGEAVFVEDPSWHTYVNTTREKESVIREVKEAIKQFDAAGKKSTLRGRSGVEVLSVDRKLELIDALYYASFPKDHKLLAAPTVVPKMITIATSNSEDEGVRLGALRLLIVIADTDEGTGSLLIESGIFDAMKSIIEARDKNAPLDRETGHNWDELSITALDVLTNICIYRSANKELRNLGVDTLLQGLLTEPGFPGLQAAMGLSHLGDFDFEAELPRDKLKALVELLRAAIDGDVAFGIKWDLQPGPLTALKYLVLHSSGANALATHNHLLETGVMEELLRILEAEYLVARDVEAALQIMSHFSQVSERARHMILLAEHTLKESEARLKQFGLATKLATKLRETVSSIETTRLEL